MALLVGALLWSCEPPDRDAPGGTTPGGAHETDATADGPWLVTHVIDGDTIDVSGPDGLVERVRVIGIDAPERDQCGYAPATAAMRRLVDGRQVVLVAGARDDRDRYGRLLRYVEVDGVDAGLELIRGGLAVARYDSRDGHGRHTREDMYVTADAASAPAGGC